MEYNQEKDKLIIGSGNSLQKILQSIPEFYDKKQIHLAGNEFLITKKIFGIRIYYKIL